MSDNQQVHGAESTREPNGCKDAVVGHGTGVEMIAAERQRQVEQEGWTLNHDDQHVGEEMATAAACYALPATMRCFRADGTPTLWPWSREWWKPTPEGRVRALVKAGALIAAEIDRLTRAESVGATGREDQPV